MGWSNSSLRLAMQAAGAAYPRRDLCGMLLHNYTRIYLDGEAADPVMALVPAARR